MTTYEDPMPAIALPTPTGQLLGYARRSTGHQTLDHQHDALSGLGVTRFFDDTMSGARDDRPGLAALLDYARAGDTVVVVALDRLGRSLGHIVRTVDDLAKRGIHIRTLRESIDTSTAVGLMLMGIFGSLAQYERTLIAERAATAREAAEARGKHAGRPRILDADDMRQVMALRASNESIPDIAKRFKISRATLYRALAEQDAS